MWPAGGDQLGEFVRLQALPYGRDREQPDVRLALRGKAFTQEIRMTSVVGKASG